MEILPVPSAVGFPNRVLWLLQDARLISRSIRLMKAEFSSNSRLTRKSGVLK